MEDMKVANIEYCDGFSNGSPDGRDPHHKDSDWTKIQQLCCFEHKECCEFIVFLGSEGVDDPIQFFNEAGMSQEFIEECTSARDAGFKYACFYA